MMRHHLHQRYPRWRSSSGTMSITSASGTPGEVDIVCYVEKVMGYVVVGILYRKVLAMSRCPCFVAISGWTRFVVVVRSRNLFYRPTMHIIGRYSIGQLMDEELVIFLRCQVIRPQQLMANFPPIVATSTTGLGGPPKGDFLEHWNIERSSNLNE